ncbi:hypothetical protein [Haloprofundus salinisoli]|uniref:hypothetical protein n=1 Tax=Haloprofundus salinisoli TaxID=2876193 RepID=UPI001CCB14F4|nr:hypothetical protein [Haloprofundus salinisoli]
MAPLPRETMESPLSLTLVAGLVALGIAGVVVNAGFWFLIAYVFLWSATLVFIADPDQFLDRIEAGWNWISTLDTASVPRRPSSTPSPKRTRF